MLLESVSQGPQGRCWTHCGASSGNWDNRWNNSHRRGSHWRHITIVSKGRLRQRKQERETVVFFCSPVISHQFLSLAEPGCYPGGKDIRETRLGGSAPGYTIWNRAGVEDGSESKQTNHKYNDQVHGKDNWIQVRYMSQGEKENWMRRKK